MDDDTKNYLNELSQETGEENIELARSGGAVTNSKKSAEKNLALSSEMEGQLTIDVYQTSSHIIVESTIAGVNPDDLDIEITPESVTIRGQREKEERVKEDDYIYQECYWGRFSRSVILPQEVDPDKSEATLKNGVLKIKLPKINREKSKKLKVNFV
ncbi:MAG: Hsp20/alpha crystallin family protein [Candidatus Liptonbacteria bacterium]|nr:Hsp20/alpha crystallin family protein [Candidatus Liptonbacteria bacterium]